MQPVNEQMFQANLQLAPEYTLNPVKQRTAYERRAWITATAGVICGISTAVTIVRLASLDRSYAPFRGNFTGYIAQRSRCINLAAACLGLSSCGVIAAAYYSDQASDWKRIEESLRRLSNPETKVAVISELSGRVDELKRGPQNSPSARLGYFVTHLPKSIFFVSPREIFDVGGDALDRTGAWQVWCSDLQKTLDRLAALDPDNYSARLLAEAEHAVAASERVIKSGCTKSERWEDLFRGKLRLAHMVACLQSESFTSYDEFHTSLQSASWDQALRSQDHAIRIKEIFTTDVDSLAGLQPMVESHPIGRPSEPPPSYEEATASPPPYGQWGGGGLYPNLES